MLFYVVDDKTRAVSSMVELGYYTGKINNTGSKAFVALCLKTPLVHVDNIRSL